MNRLLSRYRLTDVTDVCCARVVAQRYFTSGCFQFGQKDVGACAANAGHRNKAVSENLIRSVFLPRSSPPLRSNQWVQRFYYFDGLRDDILGSFSNLDCL